MVDLYFADEKARKDFDCDDCRKRRPGRAKKLGCELPGFQNIKVKRSYVAVDAGGTKRSFCPGKATWYPQIQRTFDQCLITYETGVLPKTGGFDEQGDLFTESFGAFAQAYRWRWYGKIWSDVSEFTPKVLESVAKMFGAKK